MKVKIIYVFGLKLSLRECMTHGGYGSPAIGVGAPNDVEVELHWSENGRSGSDILPLQPGDLVVQESPKLNIVSLAPSLRIRPSFASLDDVTIVLAPIALQNCCAKTETPPVPSKTTVSPAITGLGSVKACQAVSAAQGRVAASS